MAVQTRMTACDFLELPETNLPAELLNGEVFKSPSPVIQHQELVLRVAILFRGRTQGSRVIIAPMDVEFDELNVVHPDVMWIASGGKCVPVNGKYCEERRI